MIASIFIMGVSVRPLPDAPGQLSLRLKVISFFAVLCNVQSFDLMLFRHAYAGQQVYDLEQHERSHQRKDPGDQDTHELVADLAPMPVQRADGLARSKDGVDYLLSEHTG